MQGRAKRRPAQLSGEIEQAENVILCQDMRHKRGFGGERSYQPRFAAACFPDSDYASATNLHLR